LEECAKKGTGAASPVGSGPCENPTKQFTGWVPEMWLIAYHPSDPFHIGIVQDYRKTLQEFHGLHLVQNEARINVVHRIFQGRPA